MWRSVAKYVPAVVGLLFVYSGLYKLLYPAQATGALLSLDVNSGLATVTIIAVTIVELYLGTILLLRIDLKYGLAVSMGVMFLFSVFLWYLTTIAHPPSCGCMGLTAVFKSNKHNALLGLFRNCVILWLLKLAYDYYSEMDQASVRPHPGAAA